MAQEGKMEAGPHLQVEETTEYRRVDTRERERKNVYVTTKENRTFFACGRIYKNEMTAKERNSNGLGSENGSWSSFACGKS